jgi:hypothetical protein
MASGQSLSRNSLVDQSPNEGFPAAAPVFATAQLSGPAAGLTFNDLRQVGGLLSLRSSWTISIEHAESRETLASLGSTRWSKRDPPPPNGFRPAALGLLLLQADGRSHTGHHCDMLETGM